MVGWWLDGGLIFFFFFFFFFFAHFDLQVDHRPELRDVNPRSARNKTEFKILVLKSDHDNLIFHYYLDGKVF